ncbi:hypothetical protein [Desulfobacula sp.]|uniref:hypothetical protein n=1 Tax=Desulfobacula sp. TaxID=2593537 RepID=UPI0039B81E7B
MEVKPFTNQLARARLLKLNAKKPNAQAHYLLATIAEREKAFTIKPDRSDFPYRIALAMEQEGRFKKALIFINQALTLAPDNKTYKIFQTRLKTHKQ